MTSLKSPEKITTFEF